MRKLVRSKIGDKNGANSDSIEVTILKNALSFSNICNIPDLIITPNDSKKVADGLIAPVLANEDSYIQNGLKFHEKCNYDSAIIAFDAYIT